MYITLLRMFWPYLERYLAKRAAGYLQTRRERRKQGETLPPVEGEVVVAELPARVSLPVAGRVWYTLAGVLLGSAIAVLITRLMAEVDRS